MWRKFMLIFGVRLVRKNSASQLAECEQEIAEAEQSIKDLEAEIEQIREVIAAIDKEIYESTSTLANLRDNIRIKELKKSIEESKKQMSAIDIEEAAKSRRQFEDKYAVLKKKESDLQSRVSRVCGYSPIGWCLETCTAGSLGRRA
jgi:DNA repair protein RAD50